MSSSSTAFSVRNKVGKTSIPGTLLLTIYPTNYPSTLEGEDVINFTPASSVDTTNTADPITIKMTEIAGHQYSKETDKVRKWEETWKT